MLASLYSSSSKRLLSKGLIIERRARRRRRRPRLPRHRTPSSPNSAPAPGAVSSLPRRRRNRASGAGDRSAPPTASAVPQGRAPDGAPLPITVLSSCQGVFGIQASELARRLGVSCAGGVACCFWAARALLPAAPLRSAKANRAARWRCPPSSTCFVPLGALKRRFGRRASMSCVAYRRGGLTGWRRMLELCAQPRLC